MAERNGRLHNRRRMGLRKRLRYRAASSNRSGDSSAGDKGFRTTADHLDGQSNRGRIHPRVKQKRGSTRRAAQDAVFQKAFAGLCAEDRDWLSDQ